jgi:hypothetical protein
MPASFICFQRSNASARILGISLQLTGTPIQSRIARVSRMRLWSQ